MKKAYTLIFCALLLAPSITLADTSTDSNAALIATLIALVKTLDNEIQQILAQQASTNSIPPAAGGFTVSSSTPAESFNVPQQLTATPRAYLDSTGTSELEVDFSGNSAHINCYNQNTSVSDRVTLINVSLNNDGTGKSLLNLDSYNLWGGVPLACSINFQGTGTSTFTVYTP
jgi:hypothetical protein